MSQTLDIDLVVDSADLQVNLIDDYSDLTVELAGNLSIYSGVDPNAKLASLPDVRMLGGVDGGLLQYRSQSQIFELDNQVDGGNF
jgi:hypothetical protein